MTPLLLAAFAFLEMDVATGKIVAIDWPEHDKPVPAGSLVKPLVALAYAQSHGFEYPVIECRGCWRPSGHGRIGIREAVAQSCNTYFRALAEKADPSVVEALAARLRLTGPARRDVDTMVGLGDAWRETPMALLRAYVELAARRGEPGVAQVLDGMEESARRGTGKGVGVPALVKTGTAPCSHARKAPGDGYAVILMPPDRPRRAILVQVHSRPGSEAAVRARVLTSRAAGQ